MPLLDAYGRPIDQSLLKRPQGEPTVAGVRSAYSGAHPAAGLTPPRLARLLRESIDGDPERYLELAEDMEERDLHYGAVLGVRKRQVAGLQITVEAASDAAGDQEAADLVRLALDRPGFADELVDILDAIGKGFSASEILWDTSERQWMPRRIVRRDPRHFEFDRDTRETVLLRTLEGPQPLNAFGWVVHFGKAKSGLPIRGGLARAAAWAFLFKAFTVKDWAIFAEAYGQPLRVGRYGPGATNDDKEVLLRAVTSIGTDFGAIVPAGMQIDFVQASLSGSHELYERRADWLDRQVSKLVLGQTQTTDATAGGYATARVHDGVRDDIEESDARQLAATLMRDYVRPIVDLNLGPKKAYPKIVIGRPDEVDVDKMVDQVVKLVPLGLKVGMSTIRDKIGLPDPDPEEELLVAVRPPAPPAPARTPDQSATAEVAAAADGAPPQIATQSQMPPAADAIDEAVAAMLEDDGWERAIAPMIEGIEEKLGEAATLEDVRAVLAGHVAEMDVSRLAEMLARFGFSARLGGAAGETLVPGRGA